MCCCACEVHSECATLTYAFYASHWGQMRQSLEKALQLEIRATTAYWAAMKLFLLRKGLNKWLAELNPIEHNSALELKNE